MSPPIDLFCSLHMARLVSKIGYEWFCKENKINYKNDNFKDIIRFITTGEGDVINELNFYKVVHEKITTGSHLIGFYRVDGDIVYAIVSLFGLAIYQIKLGEISNICIENGVIHCKEFLMDGNILTYEVIIFIRLLVQ